MCQYSLEGYPTRDARDQETLTIISFNGGHRGFGVPGERPAHYLPLLVCVKPGMKMTLPEVELRSEVLQRLGVGTGNTWHGKRNVVVKMASFFGVGRDSDALEFEDGLKVPLLWFELGMVATVGIKERDLDKALGLDQLRAEVPRKKAKVVREVEYAPGLARLFRL